MASAQESAEIVALQALAWLAGNDALMPAFVEASGVDINEIRSRATDPALLIAVLDFILTEDAWVIGFCDANGLPYAALDQARQNLPGGARLHWT